MDKQARKSLLQRLWEKRVGRPIGAVGLIPASQNEIREATQTVYDRTSTDDRIIDEEIDGFKSELEFDSTHERERERDSLLSPDERRQLAREISQGRHGELTAAI